MKAIVSVAKGLHKITIAEGVEDEATFEMLRTFGVDCAQGYHLEKPRDCHLALAAAGEGSREFPVPSLPLVLNR